MISGISIDHHCFLRRRVVRMPRYVLLLTACIFVMDSPLAGCRVLPLSGSMQGCQPTVITTEGECPTIVSRAEWNAKPPTERVMIEDLPMPYVVIHHTYLPGFCNSDEKCKASMLSMQRYHQDTQKWFDIGYNFCIGGTGKVYEGRGWDVVGAHAPRYNNRSTGICFIGDFQATLPTPEMLQAAHSLIRCGVARGSISPDYTLLGHRQVRNTACPGDELFAEIQTWPRWQNITDIP